MCVYVVGLRWFLGLAWQKMAKRWGSQWEIWDNPGATARYAVRYVVDQHKMLFEGRILRNV